MRKRAGKSEDRLEIRIAEILSEADHEMGEAAALEKDGVEHHLQAELAARPEVVEEGLTLVRREWPTDVGPVDLMCRDPEGGWVAVEVEARRDDRRGRAALPLPRVHPASTPRAPTCRGILVAQSFKPQACTLAETRGIACVEVDLGLLRGEREPELTLFAS